MEGFAVFDPFFNAALFKKTCLKKVLHANSTDEKVGLLPLLFYVRSLWKKLETKKDKTFSFTCKSKNRLLIFGCFASEPFTFNFALRIWLSVDCVKAFTVCFGLPVDVEVRAGGEERHADSKAG